MGYRIEYDLQAKKYEVKPQGKGLGVLLIILALLAISALQFFPDATAWLIPGEDAVTVQAFHALTDDLRSGASMEEAMEAFCRYVLHGA